MEEDNEELAKLYQLREMALWHVVGTTYWTQEVQKISKEIEKVKEKKLNGKRK